MTTGLKRRLYPESTEIALEGKFVTLLFEDAELAQQFYEVLEKLRGRDFIIKGEDIVQ